MGSAIWEPTLQTNFNVCINLNFAGTEGNITNRQVDIMNEGIRLILTVL